MKKSVSSKREPNFAAKGSAKNESAQRGKEAAGELPGSCRGAAGGPLGELPRSCSGELQGELPGEPLGSCRGAAAELRRSCRGA